MLAEAAAGSADEALASAVLAAPSSNTSLGAHIWAARVADSIRTAADLHARTVPAVEAWFAARKS